MQGSITTSTCAGHHKQKGPLFECVACLMCGQRSVSSGIDALLSLGCLSIQLTHEPEAALQLRRQLRHALHEVLQIACGHPSALHVPAAPQVGVIPRRCKRLPKGLRATWLNSHRRASLQHYLCCAAEVLPGPGPSPQSVAGYSNDERSPARAVNRCAARCSLHNGEEDAASVEGLKLVSLTIMP